MAETAFNVVYDGPRVESGEMPVRDLAPALFALGEVFTEASMIVFPDRPPVALSVRATREGSFDINLILQSTGGVWDHFSDVFGSDAVQALIDLKTLVIGGPAIGEGLFQFIKWLKRRKIVAEEAIPGAGEVRVTVDDETSMTIPRDVHNMFKNVTIRKNVREVVKPLSREGVDHMEFRSETEVTLSLDEPDVPSYDVVEVPEEEELSDETTTRVLAIVAVVFAEGNKWRFTDGASTFPAVIEDPVFLRRVDVGAESFRSGDMLRCRIRTTQIRRAGTLQTQHRVIQVLEHIPREIQLGLGPDQGALPPGE